VEVKSANIYIFKKNNNKQTESLDREEKKRSIVCIHVYDSTYVHIVHIVKVITSYYTKKKTPQLTTTTTQQQQQQTSNTITTLRQHTQQHKRTQQQAKQEQKTNSSFFEGLTRFFVFLVFPVVVVGRWW